MVSQSRYLTLMRASAWYDLGVILLFVTPWSFRWVHGLLGQFHVQLGLSGVWLPLDIQHVLFATLLGSVVLVWSLARLLASSVLLGRLDGVSRVLFSCWQLYAVYQGASTLLLGFTVFEVLFGVVQFLPVRTERTQPASVALA
ncbi:hypothetical protein [Leeia aquatica]|uniref:Uncharacterized protein n=1 Tax=Leeia aquatica TaxID=2725557 RepID=A0A847SEL7_9NEIS|nr:hypothetical protein [Leeia aquatica]NLR75729.1 hypothetical protein [Leeia aquatica]